MRRLGWYGRWRKDAMLRLHEKNVRLRSEFGIGQGLRFDYDLDAGTLIFSEQGLSKVVAEVQIAGSTSDEGGDWLWAWGNPHWPTERVADAVIVRAFGEENRIRELTRASRVDRDLDALGWSLTAAMVEVTDAVGAYRAPGRDGIDLYLTLKTITWVS